MGAVVLVVAAAWFAVNMGGSGLAPSFGPILGARIISPRAAAFVFGVFVIVGAVLLGSHVAKTLSGDLVPSSTFDQTTTLVVLLATNVSLLIANLLAIPQSTSWVTVAGIVTLGLHHGNLTTQTLTHRLLPAWVLLPLTAFTICAVLVRALYPLYGSRFSLHAWFNQRTRLLRVLALASACYVAIAIGANNVPNAAGPLSAAGVLDVATGLLVLAPMFGVGAFVLSGPARTIGRGVVPLGLLTATVCNIVVASLLLVASRLGIPQSLVQLNAAAVFGVALVKEGPSGMFGGGKSRRMLLLWLVTPIVTALLTLLGLAVAP
jgi:sulfate permease